MELKFRTLRADEIECRVSQISEKGLSLLLYKDARCDMNLLDETVGPLNWERRHDRENANCTVSIYDAEKEQWISKEDTGTESNTEAEKGLASDSFKRACVNWGIGRELYTAPFIWVSADKCKIEKNAKGKLVCYDRFSVIKIEYNIRREISDLEIINAKTNTLAFKMPKVIKPATPTTESKLEPSKPQQWICKDCGKPVTSAEHNGEMLAARAIAGGAFKKLGRVLCWDCYCKAVNANEAGSSEG